MSKIENQIYKYWAIALEMKSIKNPSVDRLEKVLTKEGFRDFKIVKEEINIQSE